MRVALVHDWLTGWRGGERVLHELALLYPDADLFTLFHVPGATSSAIEQLAIHASALSRLPGAATHYRKLLPLFPWAINRFELRDYDLVISCSHAVAKGIRAPAGAIHLCYCLTPMRYVWDQADAYLGRGAMRTLARPLIAYLRRFDVRTSTPERVDRFVAISGEVKQRIRRHYGRESRVVYPPVEVERIRPSGAPPGDFFLLVGGFVPYKRDDLAIDAFRDLDARLVVVGDGPLRARLEADAPSNVQFRGRVPDAELALLLASCRALIYPQQEDFGIAAVEAQAAGRPVIAYRAGGALDTVRPLLEATDAASAQTQHEGPTTGLFFESQQPRSLADAIRRFEQIEGRFDARAIRSWAERFSTQHFRAAIQAEIAAALRDGSGSHRA